MCQECETAVDMRAKASLDLLNACMNDFYGIGPGLKATYKPIPLGPEWQELIERFKH